MESKHNMCIQYLPEELFYHIATFLSADELDACFDTCKYWRCLLTAEDRIWKRCCLYEEKYFLSTEKRHAINENSVSERFTWRQRFERQKCLHNNWKTGTYTVVNTGISSDSFCSLRDFVDKDGNHWLLNESPSAITIWNISSDPVLVKEFGNVRYFESHNIGDNLLTCCWDSVQVVQFPPMQGDFKVLYKFKFEMNSVLSDNSVIPDDDYVSGARYILVGHYYVGYRVDTDIHSTYLHVWDFDKGEKIGVITAFEQSFVDFIFQETGTVIARNEFRVGLYLFPAGSDYFLVTLIEDSLHMCQVSLFSIKKMRSLNVVARLNSHTAWCVARGDVVAIFHGNDTRSHTSHISMYNLNGTLLTTLEFRKRGIFDFSHKFCFKNNKLFFKVRDKVNVVSVIESKRVTKEIIQIKKDQYILSYFLHEILLLFDKPVHKTTCLTAYNVCTGQALWTIRNLVSFNLYNLLNQHILYPDKLFVQFEGKEELSILNFEKVM